MKKGTIIGLIIGTVCCIAVCGLCIVLGVIFYIGSSQQKQQEQKQQETNQKQQAILRVVNENARDVQEMVATVNSHTVAIEKVQAEKVAIPALTAKMREIDISKCQEDFQQVYLRYIQAFEGLGQKISQFPQTNAQALSETLASIAAKTPNPIARENDQISMQSDAVRSAWNDVQAVALRYGVTFK